MDSMSDQDQTETKLLERVSLDSESMGSSDIDRQQYAIQQQQQMSKSRRVHMIRIILDLLVLGGLGVIIFLLVQIHARSPQPSSGSDSGDTVMHRQPAGSDLSGVVPLGEVGGRTKFKSWTPKKGLWVIPEDFDKKEALNGTLKAWDRTIKPFVKADDSWDHRGPEIPLAYDLFEVSAFHQVHCLSGILEDFSYMAMGIPRAELPSVTRLEHLDWAEHNAHCFNYVLEAIMCFADTTTEGATPGNPPVVHKEATHVCNDWEALFEWSEKEEHRMPEVDGLRAVN